MAIKYSETVNLVCTVMYIQEFEMWAMFGSSLNKKINQRKNQTICSRCRLLYNRDLSECPNCSGIDDESLSQALNKRAEFRLRSGRLMLYIAIGILIVLIISAL